MDSPDSDNVGRWHGGQALREEVAAELDLPAVKATPMIVADAADEAALQDLARSTALVLSTAGPFWL